MVKNTTAADSAADYNNSGLIDHFVPLHVPLHAALSIECDRAIRYHPNVDGNALTA
jgi:hypothetical protein